MVTVGRGRNFIVRSYPQSTMTWQVHENLQHPWEQPVYTMAYIVYSLSVWDNIFSCLVVQIISILSTSLCCGVSFKAIGISELICHWKAQKSWEVLSSTHYGSVQRAKPCIVVFDHFVPIVTLFEMVHAGDLLKQWEYGSIKTFMLTCEQNLCQYCSLYSGNP